MDKEEITDPAAKEVITKLETQVENLNKGIATTRDESKAAIEAAKTATLALENYVKENPTKKPDANETKLSAEEEKKFEAWAKANGVVTQTDLDAERMRIANDSNKSFQSQAVSEFLETHPEYDSDEEWEKVQAEFNLYKTPGDLAGYRKLLDKIHKEMNPGSKTTDTEDAKAAVRADIAKREALKRGGGGNQGGNGENDAEIDKMQSRYPNLTREQIVTRLSEVRNLFPPEKK